MTEYEIVTAYRELRAKVVDPLVDWRDPRQALIAGYAIGKDEIERLGREVKELQYHLDEMRHDTE